MYILFSNGTKKGEQDLLILLSIQFGGQEMDLQVGIDLWLASTCEPALMAVDFEKLNK